MPELDGPAPLTEAHDLSAFDCGSAALNAYLRHHALNNQKAMLSRTYAASAESVVVGYYTLAIATAAHSEPPPKLVRGMPPYPIPAILMGRFGVDLTWQGKGLGLSLFTDALRRTWSLMQGGPVTARLFIVDAKDEAAKAFYTHFDMVPSPVDPMRLFLSYKALRSLFEGS